VRKVLAFIAAGARGHRRGKREDFSHFGLGFWTEARGPHCAFVVVFAVWVRPNIFLSMNGPPIDRGKGTVFFF
jgi:hypothetical protein